jgi:dinuclear metal center YbgI/SA1388 family protein
MPLIREIINVLETAAPLQLQESYDNSGLACGNPLQECTGALVALDLTQDVIEEAIHNNCNLIITHHPPIFKGLRQLTAGDAVAELIIRCISHGISVYACHTNLDNVLHGVNGEIASRLGLQQIKVLQPLAGTHRQLVVFVPQNNVDAVKNALFTAGAGAVGHYDECSFATPGTGTFRPLAGSNPFSGEMNSRNHEQEMRLEVIYPLHLEKSILQALHAAHPYETVAYSLLAMENKFNEIGAGVIGNLPEPLAIHPFLELVKTVFHTGAIRYAAGHQTHIQRVALCGGSGKSLINKALGMGADIFLTADLGYHDFFIPNGQMFLADMGHFESEQYTSNLILRLITEKIPTFAVLKAGSNTNPVNYFL